MILLNLLDIGARYGIHPNWKNFTGEANYHLVEADNDEVKRLKTKYKKYKNIKIYNHALGKENEILNLNILQNPPMSGFIERENVSPLFWGQRKKQQKIKKIKKIKTISLNNFISKSKFNFDFLKLDVEGFEVKILENGFKIFDHLLGARSEVCFTKVYKSVHVKNVGTFNPIHEMFVDQNFVLLNLDYHGKGDFYSNLIPPSQNYGQLESTDAVWIKNPKSAIIDFTMEQTIKYICFLLLNNGVDVALWTLEKTYKKFGSFTKYKNSKSLKFIKESVCKNFYSLKWIPNQKLNDHKNFYQKVFKSKYPEMNKFNEMSEFNPY